MSHDVDLLLVKGYFSKINIPEEEVHVSY